MSIDTPENIISGFPSSIFAAKAKDIYRLLTDFRSDTAVSSCYAFGEFLHLTLHDEKNGEAVLRELASRYRTQDFEFKAIAPTIEDSFIRLMKETETVPLANGKNS